MSKTKIICTLGPSCSKAAVLKKLILSGMNVPEKLTVPMLERRLRDMITFVAEPIPSRLPCGEDDAFAERQHECRQQIPEVIDALIGLRREQMQARYERDW